MDSIYSLSRCSQFHISEKLILSSLQSIDIRFTPNTFCKIAALIFFSLHFVANPPFCSSCSAWRPCLTRRGHRRHHSFCSSLKAASEHRSQTYGRNLFLLHVVTPEYVMLDIHDFHAEKQRAQAKSSTVSARNSHCTAHKSH